MYYSVIGDFWNQYFKNSAATDVNQLNPDASQCHLLGLSEPVRLEDKDEDDSTAYILVLSICNSSWLIINASNFFFWLSSLQEGAGTQGAHTAFSSGNVFATTGLNFFAATKGHICS
jgi:hypothetical protein